MAVSRLRLLRIPTLKSLQTPSARSIVSRQYRWTHFAQLTRHQSSRFGTQSISSKDSDSDSDSDFSDFSDFSDSDDEQDIDVLAKKTNFKKQSASELSEGQLMKDRLIISNLNFSTNRNDLWELCEHYGTVTDVHLPANRNRDFHNRGFGFVTFENEDDAQKALDAVAGTMFNSRQLRAGFARAESADRQRFSNDPALDRLPASSRTDFQFSEPTDRMFENTVSVPTFRTETAAAVSESTQTVHSVQTMKETAITVSGLPGNVDVARINDMFGAFGVIKNITFSPYQMMGHSMMNAIVTVALREEQSALGAVSPAAERPKAVHSERATNFSFQEQDVKDRSVDKEEVKTMRRGGMGGGGRGFSGQNKDKVGGIDPDVLAKEIDELLADTESESASDSDSDIDLDSSDSDSDSEDKK